MHCHLSCELRGKDASVFLFTQFYYCVTLCSRLYPPFSLRGKKSVSASKTLSSLKQAVKTDAISALDSCLPSALQYSAVTNSKWGDIMNNWKLGQ